MLRKHPIAWSLSRWDKNETILLPRPFFLHGHFNLCLLWPPIVYEHGHFLLCLHGHPYSLLWMWQLLLHWLSVVSWAVNCLWYWWMIIHTIQGASKMKEEPLFMLRCVMHALFSSFYYWTFSIKFSDKVPRSTLTRCVLNILNIFTTVVKLLLHTKNI